MRSRFRAFAEAVADGDPRNGTTRLVTRSGSPSSLLNRQLVSVDTAASAIVLAGCPESALAAVKAESDA